MFIFYSRVNAPRQPRASVRVELDPYAIKLVGEMVNADSVSWELKASSPVYFLMMDRSVD